MRLIRALFAIALAAVICTPDGGYVSKRHAHYKRIIAAALLTDAALIILEVYKNA